ncbi:hypothetical protein BC833DRAFT_578389 [Globomyces pollinis-pini]|nr:hypothetical protein BC833DRAFT_578389 [Globomyces pollinis-pini]
MHIIKRCMATAVKGKAGSVSGGKKKADAITDKRYILIKKMLYDPAVKTTLPSKQKQNARKLDLSTSPLYIGNDVQEKQTDVIERMWAIQQQQDQIKYLNNLKAQYTSMYKAMEALKSADERLFNGTKGKNPLDVFPKDFRIPTDTPPTNGWDYSMVGQK